MHHHCSVIQQAYSSASVATTSCGVSHHTPYLPFTGLNVLALVVLACVLLVAGVALRRVLA